MTITDLEDKLSGLAADVLTDARTSEPIARAWSLEKLDDASALAGPCSALQGT